MQYHDIKGYFALWDFGCPHQKPRCQLSRPVSNLSRGLSWGACILTVGPGLVRTGSFLPLSLVTPSVALLSSFTVFSVVVRGLETSAPSRAHTSPPNRNKVLMITIRILTTFMITTPLPTVIISPRVSSDHHPFAPGPWPTYCGPAGP